MSAVQVAVRARPLSRRELDEGTPFCLEMKQHSTILFKSSLLSSKASTARFNAKEFVFDHSYWSVSANDEQFIRQEQVFVDLGVPVLESAFQGYNACVLAYGQTGSGKTYTMMGSEGSLGLIPRICEGLFSRMASETKTSGEQVSYKTVVSYLEIYNEKVRDLLNHGPSKTHSLRVRQHPIEGPYVEELSSHDVTDYVGISQLLQLGNSHRITASTKMNDASSRSHAIFTIKFTQAKFKSGLPSETVSKIHLVDLAGSERANSTGAEGDRLREGSSINKSLVCLGTVISSLADISSKSGRQKKPHIPYRDSVLTWLLKDSLGGNSKTIMIATLSPAESSYGETLSTLRYASRAKNIVNKPTVNEDLNVKMIRELREEIQRLKSVISTGKINPVTESHVQLQRSTSMSLAEDIYMKEEQVAELTKEWAGKWKDIRRIIEENHLALRSEGVKMVVDSKQPHFVGIDPDLLSTGLVFYYLKEGLTTIGVRAGDHTPDISISSSDLSPEHCQVQCRGHRVALHPLHGDCFVNHKQITKLTKLSQGDLIQLGGSIVFRFNHPHEAAKLRKRHSQGLLLPRKLQPRSPTPRSSSSSPTFSPTLTTMTVELKSMTKVTTKQRKICESSMSLSRSQHAANGMNWGTFEEDLASTLDDDTSTSDMDTVELRNSFEVAVPKRSWCCSILIWMFAPLLLSGIGALTIPAVAVLIMLIFCMKVFGISQRFRFSRWIGPPVAASTTIFVSPVTGVCTFIFRVTFTLLTLIGVLQLNEDEEIVQVLPQQTDET